MSLTWTPSILGCPEASAAIPERGRSSPPVQCLFAAAPGTTVFPRRRDQLSESYRFLTIGLGVRLGAADSRQGGPIRRRRGVRLGVDNFVRPQHHHLVRGTCTSVWAIGGCDGRSLIPPDSASTRAVG